MPENPVPKIAEKSTYIVKVIARGDSLDGGTVTVGDESRMVPIATYSNFETYSDAFAFARGFAAAVEELVTRPDGNPLPVFVQGSLLI